jgi:erythromycin esterase-like protein
MKRGVVLLLVMGYWVLGVRAQLSNYVKKETAEIRSVQLNDTDWTDLAAFAEAIKDKRVVMLGEQTHGDGTTFALKARLVRFLHEKMGFNVLAFESDFISFSAYELVRDSAIASRFIAGNLMAIWTECKATSNFFSSYIPSKVSGPNPLLVVGFDTQLHGALIHKTSKDSLISAWERATDVSLTSTERGFAARWMDSLSSFGVVQQMDSLLALQQILHRFEEKIPKERNQLMQWCASVVGEVRNRIRFSKKEQVHYERDRQMADNLAWLLKEKYTGEKVIIWAHSAHIAKYPFDASLEQIGKAAMMGNFLAADSSIRAQSYVVGVTSFSGVSAWANTTRYDIKINEPARDGFERWIPNKYPFAFTDFTKWIRRGGNMDEKFTMKGSIYSHHQNVNLPWLRVFDGMLFVRNMEGCR